MIVLLLIISGYTISINHRLATAF